VITPAPLLARLELLTLDQLVDALVARGRRWKTLGGPEPPMVSLHLVSGNEIVGAVIDGLDLPRGSRTLLVAPSVGETRVVQRALVLPVDRLAAITLHDAADFVVESEPQPPSRLALERRARALSEQIRQLLGVALPIAVGPSDEPGGRRSLEQMLGALSEVLLDAARDDIGRAALCERIRAIEVSPGDRLSVAIDGRVLRIIAGLEPIETESLRHQVFALL
jgi:hypothetical protein